ncbi:helix-turn-helix domain-containing protein [Terrabacter aerolatus]
MSEFLRVPVATIYQWRVRHEGPQAMRIGRHLRFDPETVRAWSRDQLEVV